MTILLKEVQGVDQLLGQGTPDFKGRALIAYGNQDTSRGAIQSGIASQGWGANDETDGVFGAAGFGITGVGSLETGGSGSQDVGTEFFATLASAPSLFSVRFEVDSYGCAELLLDAHQPSSELLGLLIFGGRTLETKVGTGTFAGTGSHAITGVGFQPDLILMGGAGQTFFGEPGANVLPLNISYGAADASLNQFACSAGNTAWNGGTASRIARMTASACFLQVKPSIMQAALTSMDSDGFTLNVTSFSGAQHFWWIAIHDPGGLFSVGTGTEGDSSISPGFQPEAVMFCNSGNDALDTSQSGIGFGIGSADVAGSQFCGLCVAPSGNVVSRHYWNATAIAMCKHPPGGVLPVVTAEASVSSWTSTIGLNWTTGGAGGVNFGWVAMKTSEGPGYAGCGGFIPQIYRIVKTRG